MPEPSLWGLRRTLLDWSDRLHIARPAVRAYELALAARSSIRPGSAVDAGEIPVPPARLRAQAGPRHADARFFLRSGANHAAMIRDVLRGGGVALDELGAILDWGCGCGRILRHWAALERVGVHGCDINPRMVAWCTENLRFAQVIQNELDPPLPYADDSFDLVYALSVLTHLPEELQHRWVGECRRVLRPGGHLLISTLGEYYLSLDRLTDDERTSFHAGNVVVLYDGAPGTSLCSVYHPESYVRERLAAQYQTISFLPAAEDGRHDIYLLRKPA